MMKRPSNSPWAPHITVLEPRINRCRCPPILSGNKLNSPSGSRSHLWPNQWGQWKIKLCSNNTATLIATMNGWEEVPKEEIFLPMTHQLGNEGYNKTSKHSYTQIYPLHLQSNSGNPSHTVLTVKNSVEFI